MSNLLLVEDNPGDVELTRLAFEAADIACDLRIAESGEAAVSRLKEDEGVAQRWIPDLILLDLNLPGMGGHDFLRWLKSDRKLKRIPAIVLSSSAAADDVVLSYDLAANGYVQKPSDMAGFVAVAKSIQSFWLATAKLPPASL